MGFPSIILHRVKKRLKSQQQKNLKQSLKSVNKSEKVIYQAVYIASGPSKINTVSRS